MVSFFGSGGVSTCSNTNAFKRMNCSQYFMIFCGMREGLVSAVVALLHTRVFVQYLFSVRYLEKSPIAPKIGKMMPDKSGHP